MFRKYTGNLNFLGIKLNTAYVFGFFLLFLSLGVFHQSRRVIFLDSSQLLTSFRENDSLATATYVHQSLRVSGVLSRKEPKDNHYLTLLLKTRDPHHYIHCQMSETQTKLINELIAGMMISVQGKCVWYDEKVFLQECILVTP